MERIANLLACYLAGQMNLDDDRREQVSYGALIFVQSVAPLIVSLPIAAAIGVVPETLVAVLVATTLRRVSGGFHLGTQWRCLFYSILAFTLCGVVGKAVSQLLTAWPVWGRVLLVAPLSWSVFLIVLRYAPVAAPTRPLRPQHRERVRRNGIRLAAGYATVISVAAGAGSWWAAPGLVGLLLQGFTLTPGGDEFVNAVERILNRFARR